MTRPTDLPRTDAVTPTRAPLETTRDDRGGIEAIVFPLASRLLERTGRPHRRPCRGVTHAPATLTAATSS